MKTINITNELYNKLLKLAIKVNTNRHTANVLFQSDLVELYSSEHQCSFNIKADVNKIKEFCFNSYIKNKAYKKGNKKIEAKGYFKNFDNSDFEDYLVNELDFERFYENKKIYNNDIKIIQELLKEIW